MDDLELTKLCALAMGYEVVSLDPTRRGMVRIDVALPRGTISIRRPGVANATTYYPLHDDAQAMALVKKFDIVIEREADNSFGVTLFVVRGTGGRPAKNTHVVRNQKDLNRAIVECCARMTKAKQESGE